MCTKSILVSTWLLTGTGIPNGTGAYWVYRWRGMGTNTGTGTGTTMIWGGLRVSSNKKKSQKQRGWETF